MVVFSAFDGCACGYVALERANIPIDIYIASEVNPNAKKIAIKNYPNIIQAGDIRNIFYRYGVLFAYQYDWAEADKIMKENKNLSIEEQELLLEKFLKERDKSGAKMIYKGNIDCLIGGSPCQDLSFSGKMLGLYGNTSSALFWNYKRLLKEISPKYFLLENVKMRKKDKAIITENLKISPILINSSLVSGQNRERLYWTNIPHTKNIKDKNISLSDVLLSETELDQKYYYSDKKIQEFIKENRIKFPKSFNYNSIVGCAQRGRYLSGQGKRTAQFIEFRKDNKANCLTTVKKDSLVYIGQDKNNFKLRTLHPIEGERLQSLPDNYTKGIPETERWNVIGNGWTVDVIVEFFKKIVI